MNTLSNCQRLLRSVAGDDLWGQGCYLVPFADIAAYEPLLRVDYCRAWTSSFLDLMLCDWLSSRGLWIGRGFATVINTDLISPTTQDFVGIVFHECAHHICRPLPENIGDDNLTEFSRACVEAFADSNDGTRPEQLTPWDDHGLDFVRASCHLAHRVAKVVESVRPCHLRFASQYYPLPFNEAAFMTALADELDRTGSIRDILATPAPEAFSQRWQEATSQ